MITTSGQHPTAEANIDLARARRRHWNNQVRRHAQMIPDRPALRYLGRTVTWKELHDQSTALARALRQRGVEPGDRVMVLMLNRPEYVETLLAVTAVGAIAVPVNIRMSPAEAVFVATDVGAKAVVTDRAMTELAAAVAADSPAVEFVVTVDDAEQGQLSSQQLIADNIGELPDVDVPDESTALILYTSGTTGRPKGAMISHANLNAICMAFIDSLSCRRGDVVSVAVPLFHIGGIASVLPQLYFGGPSVIHPLGEFDGDRTLDVFEQEGTTWVFLVPAQWQAVADAQLRRPRPVSLRVLSWGAAPASDTLLRAMGDAFPAAETVAVFGQTESTGFACYLDGRYSLSKLGSVGVATSALEVRVVDDEMRDVPVGEVGEIVFRGPTVMAGYWQRPDATADAFAGGWLHSGDLGRQDFEGFLYIVDRKKDMIISGGENIYCAEVENALMDHPDIAEVAVIGRADERWGEIAVAVLALHEDRPLELHEIVEFLGPRLARFKHPKDLVVVDELPRNVGGKVLKTVLRDTFGSKDHGLSQPTA
ncbi:AMP-binding protein [Nocardia xishanensis]|uniref:AMP-binding protein n=1 Tax=Nocardia xishanensis TaxID=238964 RepID=UPI00082B9B69|nr:AMP-binding protein [Nocardia xishanensis]